MATALDLLSSALRKMPKWCEVTIVLVAAFAPFIYSSIAEILAPSASAFAEADFAAMSMHQIIVGALLLAFLFLRGWKLEELGFRRFELREVWETGLLLATYIIVVWSLWFMIGAPETSKTSPHVDQVGMSIGFVIVFSLVNASFEEVFVCAYVIAAFGVQRAWLALALSVVLRASYHLYQGPLALITILPFGLLLAWYFAKRNRIAPLIAVHAGFDILALSAYVEAGSG